MAADAHLYIGERFQSLTQTPGYTFGVFLAICAFQVHICGWDAHPQFLRYINR